MLFLSVFGLLLLGCLQAKRKHLRKVREVLAAGWVRIAVRREKSATGKNGGGRSVCEKLAGIPASGYGRSGPIRRLDAQAIEHCRRQWRFCAASALRALHAP